MAIYQYRNNPSTTLSGAITAGATSLSVASSAGFPTGGKFTIIIDSEIILVTAVAGTVWTVTRGVEDTTAASHTNNSPVVGVLTRASFLDAHWFDVRSFGAVGDAATDDRAAIQLALDAASAHGGGIVFFPPAEYRITNSITVGANTTLLGTGFASKIVQSAVDAPVVNVGASAKVVVQDLFVVGGNNITWTNNRGVHFNGATTGRVSGVRVKDCFLSVSVFSSNNIIVEDCYIENDRTTSASTGGAINFNGSNRCVARNNYVDTPNLHGIDAHNLGSDSIIEGNHVWSAGNTGIVASGHSTTGAIEGVAIVNNIIRDGQYGIIVENGANHARVAENFIFSPSADGILISDGTGDAPSNQTVVGNVIRDAGQHGIYVNAGNYVVIADNRVTVYVGDGIRVGAGVSHVVIGNIVTDGSAAAGIAIRIYAGAENTAVTGNVCRNNVGYGIYIDAANCSVTGNTVVDADSGGTLTIGGITLTGNASRATVTGNTSRRTAGTKQDYGIDIQTGCTNAMITGNNLFQNTTAASLNNGTGTTLANNITT